jgi:DNA ligase-1
MSAFRPMLASPADLDKIKYPIFASPKLDGIRASVVGGKLLSRTLKEIPSRHIFNALSRPEFEGLDGELIVGEPTSSTCYRDTVSHVMADNKFFDYTYHVFDLWTESNLPFMSRKTKLVTLADKLNNLNTKVVHHHCIENREQLDAYEAEQVNLGHEGIMLADPNAAYKFGRATTKGGELLKVKRFVDAEAIIIGIEEEMFNGNEAETNELGRTKRSTAKAGLVGKGTMGALIVRCQNTGVEFNIGTGFTAQDRQNFWDCRELHLKAQTPVKYKSFPIGVKDKPRHPVFLGVRPLGA